MSPQTVVVAPVSTTRFSAAVAGVSDTRVRWSADGGTIDQNGSWTAPQSTGAYRVMAESIADSAKAGLATALVSDGVAVSIEPDQVMVPAGVPLQFSARVMGTDDTAVSWSVDEPTGGTTIDATGTFVSPFEGIFRVVVTSHADAAKTAVATVTVTADVVDHGGPVMPTTRTFALWWGDPNAFPPDAHAAIEKLLRGLDGSRYFAIADQYMRGTRATTTFGGSLFDPSVPPPAPTGFDVNDAACRALDANGIVPEPGDLVLVHTSNFPAEYIKWCNTHGFTFCSGQAILVAYSPNPSGTFCEAWRDSCGAGYTLPTLSLLSGASHEIMEAITNPFGNGWHGAGWYEGAIADKCGNLACVPLPTGIAELQDVYSNAIHGCTAK